MTITRVGVLGNGPLGRAFGHALGRAGIATLVGDSASEDYSPIADAHAKSTAGTLRQAAEEDIVFLSVPWGELQDTLAVIADWESRILIDATNAIGPDLTEADLGGRTSSELVGELSPGAQLVKAFNTLTPDALSEPNRAESKRVVFLSGDHVRAKVEVGRLISQLGFAGIDLGSLSAGGRLHQFPDGPLWDQNLVKL
jgi:predicted dinucleotide-binding enzyme